MSISDYIDIKDFTTQVAIFVFTGGLTIIVWLFREKIFNFNKNPKPTSQNTVIHGDNTVKNSNEQNESHDGHANASGQGSIAIGNAQNVNINQDNSNVQMPVEELQRRIELERKDAVEDTISDLPESVKKAHERIDNIETILTYKANKTGNSKLAEASDAIEKGDFSKADALFTEAEANEKLTGKNAAYAAYGRGQIAEHEVRWNDAVEHYARAVQFDSCFETLISLQRLFRFTKDYDSALSFCLDAQKSAIMQYGKNSKQYAHSVSGLAAIYNKKGEYKLAEQLYKEALKIRQNVFGEKHPAVALSLNNLGAVYRKQRRYKEAEDFFNQAINMYKETGGVNRPDAAMSIGNLADIYASQGNYEKAEPLFKQALKIRKEIQGLRHPATANSFNSLGCFYLRQKRYKEAEPFIRQALEIFEAIFGHDHPRTKSFKGNYELLKKDIANAEKTSPK